MGNLSTDRKIRSILVTTVAFMGLYSLVRGEPGREETSDALSTYSKFKERAVSLSKKIDALKLVVTDQVAVSFSMIGNVTQTGDHCDDEGLTSYLIKLKNPKGITMKGVIVRQADQSLPALMNISADVFSGADGGILDPQGSSTEAQFQVLSNGKTTVNGKTSQDDIINYAILSGKISNLKSDKDKKGIRFAGSKVENLQLIVFMNAKKDDSALGCILTVSPKPGSPVPVSFVNQTKGPIMIPSQSKDSLVNSLGNPQAPVPGPVAANADTTGGKPAGGSSLVTSATVPSSSAPSTGTPSTTSTTTEPPASTTTTTVPPATTAPSSGTPTTTTEPPATTSTTTEPPATTAPSSGTPTTPTAPGGTAAPTKPDEAPKKDDSAPKPAPGKTKAAAATETPAPAKKPGGSVFGCSAGESPSWMLITVGLTLIFRRKKAIFVRA